MINICTATWRYAYRILTGKSRWRKFQIQNAAILKYACMNDIFTKFCFVLKAVNLAYVSQNLNASKDLDEITTLLTN